MFEIGGQAAHQRGSAADRDEYRQIAAADKEGLKRALTCAAMVHGVLGDGEHPHAKLYLGIFVAVMVTLVVCGCILTRKPKKTSAG